MIFLFFSFLLCHAFPAIKRQSNEPTCRCQSNPLIGALGIQEPVIPGEPLIKG